MGWIANKILESDNEPIQVHIDFDKDGPGKCKRLMSILGV